MTEIQDFIRGLPKAELHLHLEGTIAPATLVELSARHDTYPLTLYEAEALYRFTDFTEFIESFKAVTRRLRDPEDYELAAWRMMQHLAAQGVVHAEVFISVGVIYMWRNFDPRCFEPIFAGLERARERAARELGLSLYWIFDAVRHFTVEEAERVFRKAAELRESTPPSSPSVSAETSAAPAPSLSAHLYEKRARSRPAPHQPRRRNHRSRSHLGSSRHRLRTHRPRPIRHSRRRSTPRPESPEDTRSS